MDMKLSRVALFDAGRATDGMMIKAYGHGQLAGAVYTIPAHGEVNIDLTANIMSVTPDNVATLSALIRSLLDASHQHLFDEVEKKSFSGGLGFFGFWGGSAHASYEDTKHTMDGWGLSEVNQQKIVSAMMSLTQQLSAYHLQGTIHNTQNDYAVSGSLFGIVMDCEITQGNSQNQVRLLAPHIDLVDPSGTTLMSGVGNIYR